MTTKPFKAIPSFTYAGRGFVSLKDGNLTIGLTDQTENRASAFTVADDTVEVVTRNVREERLKATERDEADLLDDFAERFVQAQRRIIPRRKTLSEGDRVCVSGIREDANDDFWCKPVGSDEEWALFNDELVVGTDVKDLMPYLYEDDFIKGAHVESDDAGLGISIRDAYLSFAVQTAQVAFRNKHFFKGRVLYVDDDKQRILWMTACGFFGISRIKEGVKAGDEAVLYVVNTQFRSNNTYINVDLDENGGEGKAVQSFDEEKLLADFILDAPPADTDAGSDDAELVRRAARTLGSANPIGALEKYRTLLAARFLAEAVQDAAMAQEYASRANILQRKLLYAQGKPVRALDNAPDEIACLMRLGVSVWQPLLNRGATAIA